MKKTLRISLFFLLILTISVTSFGIGYLFSSRKFSWDEEEKESIIASDNLSDMSLNKTISEEETLVSKTYQFLLKEKEGYVHVYWYKDMTSYSKTDIEMIQLPDELQEEIRIGKPIETERELFYFLENYTS